MEIFFDNPPTTKELKKILDKILTNIENVSKIPIEQRKFDLWKKLIIMDISEQYRDLTEKIENNLPLTAIPTRELVQDFRDKGNPITLKTELTITNIHNSGDISGIMCTVLNDNENVIICSLTHLIFSPKCPLYQEICDYQKKREKRIKKLNQMGLS